MTLNDVLHHALTDIDRSRKKKIQPRMATHLDALTAHMRRSSRTWTTLRSASSLRTNDPRRRRESHHRNPPMRKSAS